MSIPREYLEARRQVRAEIRKSETALRKAMNGYASITTQRRSRRAKKLPETLPDSGFAGGINRTGAESTT